MSAKVSRATSSVGVDAANSPGGAVSSSGHPARSTPAEPSPNQNSAAADRGAGEGTAALVVNVGSLQYRRAFGRALQTLHTDYHAVASIADVSPATGKNWWHGRNVPNGAQYHRLIVADPKLPRLVQRELARELDREIRQQPGFDRAHAATLDAIRDEVESGGFDGTA